MSGHLVHPHDPTAHAGALKTADVLLFHEIEAKLPAARVEIHACVCEVSKLNIVGFTIAFHAALQRRPMNVRPWLTVSVRQTRSRPFAELPSQVKEERHRLFRRLEGRARSPQTGRNVSNYLAFEKAAAKLRKATRTVLISTRTPLGQGTAAEGEQS